MVLSVLPRLLPSPVGESDERHDALGKGIAERIEPRCKPGPPLHRTPHPAVPLKTVLPSSFKRWRSSCLRGEAVAVEAGAADHLARWGRSRSRRRRGRPACFAGCQAKPRRGPKLVRLVVKGERLPLLDVDLGAGVGDAARLYPTAVGIEVLQAVMPLRPAAEDIPAKPRGDGESVSGMVGVLKKAA